MLVKKNKDKENAFSYRRSLCPSPQPDRMSWTPVNTAEYKNRHYGNSVMLNLALHKNKKILKMRRNSNLNTKTFDAWQMGEQVIETVEVKRMSLCDNRERSKKSCRSVGANHEQPILKQSNFNLLKEEAKRLDEDFSYQIIKKWKPVVKIQQLDIDSTSVKNKKLNESTGIIDSIKQSRHANMGKIVKGRPQIKKLLEQNRQKYLKQKALEYVDVLMIDQTNDVNRGIKIRRVGKCCGGCHTIQ